MDAQKVLDKALADYLKELAKMKKGESVSEWEAVIAKNAFAAGWKASAKACMDFANGEK